MDLESTLIDAGCKVVGSAATLDKAKLIVKEVQRDMNFAGVTLTCDPTDERAAALTRKKHSVGIGHRDRP
jgi:hypothetical protein